MPTREERLSRSRPGSPLRLAGVRLVARLWESARSFRLSEWPFGRRAPQSRSFLLPFYELAQGKASSYEVPGAVMLKGRDDMVMGAACAVVAIMRLARAVSTRFVLVCMDVLYFEFAPSCDRSRLVCSFDPLTNKKVRNEQPKIRPHGCDTDREPIMIALLLAEVVAIVAKPSSVKSAAAIMLATTITSAAAREYVSDRLVSGTQTDG
jgi:hypothetical protein